MEYYIHSVPVFVMGEQPECSIPDFCSEAEEVLYSSLLANVDVVYVVDTRELAGRNASYSNGAIYMTNQEPTVDDMLENFVHEVAHSLEESHGGLIYGDDLVNEFKGKRNRLYHLLSAAGYDISPQLYGFTEYNKKFDNFLANEVGYPTLLTLTMGLFVSPYGATSIQEYFANGFEKYFLEGPRHVRSISPVLYEKIEAVVHGEA
jgi:Mlc titration factor MtfA (ptsG expression regulator)